MLYTNPSQRVYVIPAASGGCLSIVRSSELMRGLAAAGFAARSAGGAAEFGAGRGARSSKPSWVPYSRTTVNTACGDSENPLTIIGGVTARRICVRTGCRRRGSTDRAPLSPHSAGTVRIRAFRRVCILVWLLDSAPSPIWITC